MVNEFDDEDNTNIMKDIQHEKYKYRQFTSLEY